MKRHRRAGRLGDRHARPPARRPWPARAAQHLATGNRSTAPRPIQVACPLPRGSARGAVQDHRKDKGPKATSRRRHGKPLPIRIICPNIPAKPSRRAVGRRSSASTWPREQHLTEVSGPILAPPQEFSYDGNTYTIMSVNPGADSFTVFVNGWLFVNKGAAITDGIGLIGLHRLRLKEKRGHAPDPFGINDF